MFSHSSLLSRAARICSLASLLATLGWVGLLGGPLTGCTEVPTFPDPPVDAGVQCTDGTPTEDGPPACPSGEICLDGRCYEACSSDSQCGLRETCSSGACVPRSGPLPDAGFSDPCDGVVCDEGLLCHPDLGICVQCVDGSTCPVDAPVCDRARGVCANPPADGCTPCQNNAQCTNDATGFMGTCLETTGPTEQFCAQACDDVTPCPQGFDCQGGNCRVLVGSCTGWTAALARRACSSDADCAPLGATPGDVLFTGSCAIPDGIEVGNCRQPCGSDLDCPSSLTCIPDSTLDPPSSFCM